MLRGARAFVRHEANIIDVKTRLTFDASRYTRVDDESISSASTANQSDRFAYFAEPAPKGLLAKFGVGGNRLPAWRSVRVDLSTGEKQLCLRSVDWPHVSFPSSAISVRETRMACVLENVDSGRRSVMVAPLPSHASSPPAIPGGDGVIVLEDLPPHIVSAKWLDDEKLLVTYGRSSPLMPDAVALVDVASRSTVPLFVESDSTRVIDVRLSQDHKFAVMRSESHRNTEYRFVPVADAERGFVHVLFPRQFDSFAVVRHEHNRFWIAHDVGRARGCIEQLDALADDAEFDWRNRVPVISSLPKLSINYFDVFANHLQMFTTSTRFGMPVLALLRNFSELVLHRMPLHALSITSPHRSTNSKEAIFFTRSLFRADDRAHKVDNTTLAVDMAPALTCQRDRKFFDIGTHVTVEHLTVDSINGVDLVKVPVVIVRAKGTPVDGTAKCMQYVYGAYGDSWPFSFGFVELEALLNDGWILALCGVRGGGELGSRWADQGAGQHKDNSFIDTTSCGKWLVQHGYAARDSLCISGRSAGAFTAMGAVAREPTLYAVMLGIKPLVDPDDEDCELSPVDNALWGSFRPLETLPELFSNLGEAAPSVWMHATEEDEHAPIEPVKQLLAELWDEDGEEHDNRMRFRLCEKKKGHHSEVEAADVTADAFAFAAEEIRRRREMRTEPRQNEEYE